MTDILRIASGSGSLAVNAVLLLAFQLTQPLGYGRLCAGWREPPLVLPISAPWRPFIDNPGEDSLRADRHLRCPQAAGLDGGVRLDAAPLPDRYDPYGYPDRAIFACVRVDEEGRVTAAKLIGARIGGTAERRLLAAIRSDWRFAIESFGPSVPTWQQVRVNAAAVDEAIWYPPQIE